jgi:hypothetical protein
MFLLWPIRRLPFTCYALAATGLLIWLQIAGTPYDSGGVGGFLVLTGALWAFPFYFAHEIGMPWFVGFVPFFVGDWLLARVRRMRAQGDANGSTKGPT